MDNGVPKKKTNKNAAKRANKFYNQSEKRTPRTNSIDNAAVAVAVVVVIGADFDMSGTQLT